MRLLQNILACLVLMGISGYTLYYHVYIIVGVVSLLGVLCVALPTPLEHGADTFKSNAAKILPAILGALKGKADDPK